LDSEDVTRSILVTEEEGQGEFALHLEIEPQSARTLKLLYDLPQKLNLNNLSRYPLLVQKQPGTEGDSFTFLFEKPFGLAIDGSNSPESLQKEGDRLIFEGELTRDLRFEITILE